MIIKFADYSTGNPTYYKLDVENNEFISYNNYGGLILSKHLAQVSPFELFFYTKIEKFPWEYCA